MGRITRCILTMVAIAVVATAARAVDVPVAPKKLVVVDKLAASGVAKTVYVAEDVAIAKGTGTDPEEIGAQFEMSYAVGSATGSFVVPMGSANGWLANSDTVAKFVNQEAPSGSTQVRVVVIKPGKLLRVVAKGLGDTPLDLFGAGAPLTTVLTHEQIMTRLCVQNGPDESCFESRFTDCAYKTIAAETGAKLVCKHAIPPPSCCEVTDFFSFTCLMTQDCAGLGGTSGPPGSVCDATGACVVPPGVPGDCCESTVSLECGFGPQPSDCATAGGMTVPGTVCERNGRCQ
jgi:hypothetical protein